MFCQPNLVAWTFFYLDHIGKNAGFSGTIFDFTGNEWWFER